MSSKESYSEDELLSDSSGGSRSPTTKCTQLVGDNKKSDSESIRDEESDEESMYKGITAEQLDWINDIFEDISHILGKDTILAFDPSQNINWAELFEEIVRKMETDEEHILRGRFFKYLELIGFTIFSGSLPCILCMTQTTVTHYTQTSPKVAIKYVLPGTASIEPYVFALCQDHYKVYLNVKHLKHIGVWTKHIRKQIRPN